MVKSPYIGDKLIPPLIGNPYNGTLQTPTIGLMSLSPINGSLDPSTYEHLHDQKNMWVM